MRETGWSLSTVSVDIWGKSALVKYCYFTK